MEYRELIEDEIAVFLTMSKASDETAKEMYNGLRKQTHVLDMLWKRSEAYGVALDLRIHILLLTLGDGIPANCIQHADYVMAKAIDMGMVKVTFNDYIYHISPMGVPNF